MVRSIVKIKSKKVSVKSVKVSKGKFTKDMPMGMINTKGMKDMHVDSKIANDNGGVLNRKKNINTYGMKYLKS